MNQSPEDGNERFIAFVHMLERISAQYGVLIHVTGGVQVMSGPLEGVQYDRDPTSGDIHPLAVKEPNKAWTKEF